MNLYVVTGTTQGLGAALAARLAAMPGTELVTLSRSRATLVADLADLEAVERAGDELGALVAGKRYGKAVLINNAGVIDPVGPLDEADPGDITRNLTVNLLAPMLLMRSFLRATAAVPLRRIINISSGAGRRAIFGWSAYCAAKAGIDMASRTVALECQSRGLAVEVTSLAPGVIDTAMQGTVRAASAEDFIDVERFRQMKAEGQLRRADDVAADILRLEAAGRLGAEAVQDLRELQ
ncbi:MAG TPA: SDR family NAD(P)-dependent oxidoreductase [Usitatibacter sp.]|nr:SDR family NAD(P)-dependent oxidoreductase [Usitatibacter sp.]